jgi:hypothetical protein
MIKFPSFLISGVTLLHIVQQKNVIIRNYALLSTMFVFSLFPHVEREAAI